MAYEQSVSGCLESVIGASGLSEALLRSYQERLDPALQRLREQHAGGSFPLLQTVDATEDIEVARAALDTLCCGARTLIFFGTGGSSLGGQTIAQLGGWYIPGDQQKGQERRPRTRFYDNLDPRTLQLTLAGLDLSSTRVVVISKSGNTPETLVQALAAIDAFRSAGLADRLPELMLGLTEAEKRNTTNGLRAVLTSHGIPVLEHDPEIGGRFSALTNVGLLPALARGLDALAFRRGAKRVVDALINVPSASDFAPAVGAATAVALAKERGIRAVVMMPYSDRLGRFANWFVQLWAESLGKGGEGTTPVAALGPVDQHSQLQLYLDGPSHHMLTIIRTACAGVGPLVPGDLAALASADYLAERCAGDLVAAQQRAIPQAVMDAGRPVRTIDIENLDEEVLGGLMMHFMIETILAARLLGVDPFDQPAVEAGKQLTKRNLTT